jgi:hypothetical protein
MLLLSTRRRQNSSRGCHFLLAQYRADVQGAYQQQTNQIIMCLSATEGHGISARYPDLHLTQLQETIRHSLDAARLVQFLTVGREKVNSVAQAANRNGAIRLFIQNVKRTGLDGLSRIQLAGFQENPAAGKGMLNTAGEAQLASLSQDWLQATQSCHSTGDKLHSLQRTFPVAVTVNQENRSIASVLPVQGNRNIVKVRVHRDQLNPASQIDCLAHAETP